MTVLQIINGIYQCIIWIFSWLPLVIISGYVVFLHFESLQFILTNGFVTKSVCILKYAKQKECMDWLCDEREYRCRIYALTDDHVCHYRLIPLIRDNDSNCDNIEAKHINNDKFSCFVNCNQRKYSKNSPYYILMNFAISLNFGYIILKLISKCTKMCCNNDLVSWICLVFIVVWSICVSIWVQLMTDEFDTYVGTVKYGYKMEEEKLK